MVSHKWWMALALVGAGGCSSEFGGRCDTVEQCGEAQICVQGYCLPPEAAADAAPDDGIPDDVGVAGDGGGRIDLGDGDPVDAAVTPDMSRALCDPIDGRIPAYDEAFGHRACPDEDTVALWRFDGAYEPLGPNGEPGPALADGRDRDAVQLTEDGIGGAARFVGDDQRVVRLGLADEEIYNDEPMTIEMWVRFVAFDDDYQVLLSTLDISGRERGGLSLYIDREGERYAFGAAVSNQLAEGQIVPVDAADRPLTPGEWVHLAMRTRRSGNDGLELYVNGERGSDRGWAVFGSSTAPLRFGETSDSPGPRYEGLIDEVRISRTQRDREDFQAASRNPPPG